MLNQLIALFWGMAIGFAVSVPIGPVGIICVQRTIAKNRLMGLVTGLGASITDGFLASVGAFGITIISDFIVREQVTLRLVGGGILIFLGLVGLFSKPKEKVKKADTAITVIEHFFSAVILTATNPLAALSFFVAFAGVGPRLGIGAGEPIGTSLVLGVVIGSGLWWLILTYLADTFGHKIKPEHLQTINRWFAGIVGVLGLIIILGVIF